MTGKRTIKIEHLLTMSHDIRTRDSFLFDWKGLFEMWSSPDWVQYIMDLPVNEVPGGRYDYSNMGSFLLSAIIEKQTGLTAHDFAYQGRMKKGKNRKNFEVYSALEFIAAITQPSEQVFPALKVFRFLFK